MQGDKRNYVAVAFHTFSHISNTIINFLEKQLPSRQMRNGDYSDVDASGYARIARRSDQMQQPRRHHRRSTRSASASRESDICSPLHRYSVLSKDHISRDQSNHDQSNGTSDLTTSTKHADSGASTSSGVVEESNETMKESSEECHMEQQQMMVIVCSECRGQPNRGVIFQCTVCQNVFLCSECENRGIHDEHIMLRLKANANGHFLMPM